MKLYHNIPIVYLVKPIYTQSHIYRSISIPTAINRNRSPFLKMYDETVSEMSVAQGFTGEGLTPKEIDKVLDDKIQEVSETLLRIHEHNYVYDTMPTAKKETPKKETPKKENPRKKKVTQQSTLNLPLGNSSLSSSSSSSLFDDIELFYNEPAAESSQTTGVVEDKRKTNGSVNDRRENVLTFIANHRELPEEYAQDTRWSHLHAELHKVLLPYYDTTDTTGYVRFVKKAGRMYNYDFEFTSGSVVVKFEFKYCGHSPRIDALPQIYQGTTSTANIFNAGFPTFDEYYYDNGLSKYLEIDSQDSDAVSSQIDKATYLKHVKNANSTHPFFCDLKSRVNLNVSQKNAVVNESIENYLKQCQSHINIPAVNELLQKQKGKTYLMWHPKTRQFYTEQIPEHELTITRVANITSKHIVFVAATYSYYFLLRWKNRNGILNPAWQIKVKKIQK